MPRARMRTRRICARRFSGDCIIKRSDDRALLALQGPVAEAVLAAIGSRRRIACASWTCARTRSSAPNASSPARAIPARTDLRSAFLRRKLKLFARKLLWTIRAGGPDRARARATACASKRACASTAPISMRAPRRWRRACEWAIPKARRSGGARAGGFPGREVILRSLPTGRRAAASGCVRRSARPCAPAARSIPTAKRRDPARTK